MKVSGVTLAANMDKAVAAAKRAFAGYRPRAETMNDLGFIVLIGDDRDELGMGMNAARIGFDARLTCCPFLLMKGTPGFCGMVLNFQRELTEAV